MEEGAQKQEIQKIRKWRDYRTQLAASAKQAGGGNGRGRDDAAAKNDDFEGSDKENKVKMKNGR